MPLCFVADWDRVTWKPTEICRQLNQAPLHRVMLVSFVVCHRFRPTGSVCAEKWRAVEVGIDGCSRDAS
jgi:hypothetical protein